jgi:hypothetical protein
MGRRRSDHYKFPGLAFGTVCMVSEFEDKRVREAADIVDISPKNIHVSELGVCLGFCPSTPGSYEFIVSNGSIFPRRVIEIVQVHPFDWKRKSVLRAELRLPSVYPEMIPRVDSIQRDVQFPSSSYSGVNTFTQPIVSSPLDSVAKIDIPVSTSDAPIVIDDVLAGGIVDAISDDNQLPLLPASLDIIDPTIASPDTFIDLPVAPLVEPLVVSSPIKVALSNPMRHSTRSNKGVSYNQRMASLIAQSYSTGLSKFSLDQMVDLVDSSLVDDSSVSQLFVSAVLPSDSLIPIPSTQCKEIPLRRALREISIETLTRSSEVEMNKQLSLNCLSSVHIFDHPSQLPKGSIVVDAHILYKVKADGRETCRITAMGNRLPFRPDIDTYAGVASDSARMFALSSMQAHCELRNERLIINTSDVRGGFLHVKLDSSVPMFLKLPLHFPHKLAGKLILIEGAIYGLPESNNLFGGEMSATIVSAGFKPTNVEP